ncbi:MAG: ABC transporter substrate-binding protein, partial [Clostridia bacterium]|nr:ABC transporter substrate-binding protein [Clostridia bacterium]
MKKFTSFIVAMCMLLSACACALADEPLKVGVIGPLTGGAVVYGKAVERGALIAAEEINALGGLQIKVLSEDDEHVAEKGVNAFNAILDNGGQVILGTVTTAPCIAVAAEAYEERVFMLTPSASSTEVIKGRDNVYQVCFTDPAQGAASAEYIFNKQLATKVGIIYNNGSDYS